MAIGSYPRARRISINRQRTAGVIRLTSEGTQRRLVRAVFHGTCRLLSFKAGRTSRLGVAQSTYALKIAQHVALRGGKRFLGNAGTRETLAQELGQARTLRQRSKIGRGEIKLPRDKVDVLPAQVSQF